MADETSFLTETAAKLAQHRRKITASGKGELGSGAGLLPTFSFEGGGDLL